MPISISKIILVSFVSLLAIALAISAGIYAWQKNHPQQVACTMEARQCPDGSYVSRTGPNCEFAKCPEAQAVDTSNWKTYKNDKHSFEFKYPNDWQLAHYEDKLSDASLFTTLTSPSTISIQKRAAKNKQTDIPGADISLFVLNKNATLENYLKSNVGPGNIVNYKKFSFNGYDAYEVIWGGYGKNYSILTERNNKIYEIYFELREQGSDLSPIEKQIISTFKFIEPQAVVDTSGWKTYRNEKYGFNFKYPPGFHIFSFNDYQQDPAYKNDPNGFIFSIVLEEDVYAGRETERPYISFFVGKQGSVTNEQYIGNKIQNERDMEGNIIPLLSRTTIASNPPAYKLNFGPTGSVDLFKSGLVYQFEWWGNTTYGTLVDQMFTTLRISDNSTGSISSSQGWKTYRNEKYGFEVKYPADWKVSMTNLTGTIPMKQSFLIADSGYCEGTGCSFVIQILNKSADNVRQEMLKVYGDEITSDHIISLAGREARELFHKSVYGEDEKMIIMPYDNQETIFISEAAGSDIHAKILSSFKFTK